MEFGKFFKQYLPFITGIVIAGGYAKLSIYYSHFTIRIQDYIEFSEIFRILLSEIIAVCLLLIAGLVFNVLIESKKVFNARDLLRQNLSNTKSILSRAKIYFQLHFEFILMGASCFVFYFIQNQFMPDVAWVMLFCGGGAFLFIL